MKTIALQTLENDPALFDEIEKTLENGGLVCLPCNNTYRLVADLSSEDAVRKLLQSKRRTRKAPSLVFIAGKEMLDQVAAEVDPVAERLTRAWPGPLTILFEASHDIPAKVAKQLSKANGKIGVRVPQHPIAKQVVQRFGRPLLVSSANREDKQGAHSAAQVRKNFANRIDIFVDAGDLKPAPTSTVVDVKDGAVVVRRAGALDGDEVKRLAAA